MRQGLAAAMFLAFSACQAAAIDANAPACFSIRDCTDNETCFFGKCVDPAARLGDVFAEIKPPNDSQWIEQQLPGPLNLRDGFQAIALRDSVVLTGKVLPGGVDGKSLTGTMVLRATTQGIPGRNLVRQVNVTEAAGFSLRVLPESLHLSFQPTDPGLMPPKDFWAQGNAGYLPLPYPTASELDESTLFGRVAQTEESGTAAEDVRVAGSAADPIHPDTPFRSTFAITDDSGAFEITFLPEALDAPSLDILVSPNPGVAEYFPEVSFPGQTPAGNDLGDLVLGVTSNTTTVTAVVKDGKGNPVEAASVLFEGSVGTANGTFVVSGSSDESGNVDATLLPGEYTVTVAPQNSQDYSLSTFSATIAIDSDTLELVVSEKVRLQGNVTDFDGERVANAKVTFTRKHTPVSRVFHATTDSRGDFDIWVDGGALDAEGVLQPAEYELTVQPPADSGQPFFLRRTYVWGDGRDEDTDWKLALYEPDLVYGMVRDPNGMPLANVILAFYSLELGEPGQPVLVGVVSTLADERAGEFVLPVPIP